MSLQIHNANICEQTTNFFFYKSAFLEFLFFFQNHDWELGVRLIHETLR